MNLTKHAEIRMQQRAIPNLIVDWLIDYGEVAYAKHGVTKHSFSKKSIRNIKRVAGHSISAYINDYRNAYVVVVDDKVITTAWRQKRMKS